MKKVLMIGFTPPEEGGSERHIYEISSRMSTATILTQKGSICNNKVELSSFGKSTLVRNLSFLFFSLMYTIRLLFNKKYDVIHIHENLLYFLVPLLRLRHNVVVTVHGIEGFKFYDNKLLWFFFRFPLKFANGVIAVNLKDQDNLAKYFKKVFYIPNGVDTSIYDVGIVKVENKIGFIGRIHEQKGLIYLLEAFKIIQRNHPKIKLELIGKVEDYGLDLQKRFQDKNIIWKGFISNRKEIAKSLRSSYCIILPSLWEGLPLTLFEALASGRPVVLSDIPAFKSVVKNEAVFFKSKDVQDLAKKVDNLLTYKKEALNMGKKGKNLAKSYDWKEISLKTGEIYDKL